MTGEISEAEARGEIAAIFTELRTLWGVPYVSAIHRYLAAKPGFLEWAWDAVAPAFNTCTPRSCSCATRISASQSRRNEGIVYRNGLQAVITVESSSCLVASAWIAGASMP